MRIALVSQEYPPETAKGGMGVQTYRKAQGLAARGHEVHVLSRSPHGAGRSEREEGGVHLVRVPGWENRMGLYTEVADWVTYSAEVASALTNLHKGRGLELVDFAEWGAEGYVYFLNRSEWNDVCSVVQLHGPLVMLAHTLNWPAPGSEFYRTGKHMEETCVRLADAVYSSSRCSADWCVKHYGLDADSIPVIHTGVDTSLFAPRPVPKAEVPTILFVGKVTASKGVDILVKSACELAPEFPGLLLVLLGRGEPHVMEELQRRARHSGFPDLIEMRGPIPHDQLLEHYSRAHIFAAPSPYEGGPGFVYLEAMACGLPVVGCLGSGAAEVVRAGVNGLLVRPGDTEGLTDALRRLLQDAALRERLGEGGRQFVLAEADSRRCLEMLEEFYARVLSGRRLARTASPGATEPPEPSRNREMTKSGQAAGCGCGGGA